MDTIESGSNPDPDPQHCKWQSRYWFLEQENHFISGKDLCTLKNWSLSLNGVSSVETTSPLAAGRAMSVPGGFGARSGGGSLRPSVGGRWRVDTSWLERISSDSGLYLAARRLALQSTTGGILSAPPLTCAALRISLMAGRSSCRVSVLFSLSARFE
jgi:hypothetical protein